jgi:hypothetical protein
MSAPHGPVLEAIARRLLLLLDAYEASVDALVEAWPDARACDRASGELDEIRRLAGTLRSLGARWAELLITHAELVQQLGRMLPGHAADRVLLATLRRRHAHAAQAMRSALTWLLPAQ